MDEIEEDVAEVLRLLNLTQRSLPRRFLVQLLANLQQATAHYQQQQEAQRQPQLQSGLRQDTGYHNGAANLLVPGLQAGMDGYHQQQTFLPGRADAYGRDIAVTGSQSTRPAPEALQLTSLAQTTKALDLAQLDAIWHHHDGAPASFSGDAFGSIRGDAAHLAALNSGFSGLPFPSMKQGMYRDAANSGLLGLHDVGALGQGGSSGQLPDLEGRFRADAGLVSGNFLSNPGVALRRDVELQDAYYDQRAAGGGQDHRKNGYGQGMKAPMGRLPGGLPGPSMQYPMAQGPPQIPSQIPPQMKFALSQPMPAQPVFHTLSTCSWEQTESAVKVYVPLRGVHTELLRAVFEPNSVEVKVINLKGKTYVFNIAATFRPINPSACLAVASMTKKNILITIKKLNMNTMDEKHWDDLYKP